MSSEYRVNKSTGQVVKDDGTGWKPVASVRNKATGEILIDEGNGWQPMPGSQRSLQSDPAMTMASQRANTAMASGQKIAQDDLTQLGRPDFSGASMARLPPPTQSTAELDAFDTQRRAEKEALRVPDSNFKERSIIAMNVPTFGSGPRLAAGAQTVGALLATPFIEGDIIDQKGISGATSQFLDEARIHQRRGRTERPVESIATEVIPSLVQGKTIIDTLGKRVLPATNTVSNVGRVAGVGGLYGAIYAGSQNESGTAEGVAGDAAFGGTLGAGFGLGFKAVEPAAVAGYRTAKTGAATLSDALSDMLGKAGGARDKVAGEVAIAAVRRSADRSGLTMEQMLDLVKKYEGKPAVLAEVIGQDALNALTALTRRPGSTSQKATDIAEARATMLPDRAKGDLEDASGIQIGNIDETLTKQLDERQAAAKPLYDALYNKYRTIESFRKPGQTGQVQKRLNRLARTPILQRHLELADTAMKTSAAVRGIPVSKMSVMERWDLVKRSLDDAIDSAVAKGEARTRVGESVGDLVRLKEQVVGELDRLTDNAYAAAREAGGEAPRLRAAATAGQKALGARNPKEVAKTVAATLAQDLPAMRAGMVDDIATRIDKPGFSPRRFRSPDLAGKVRAVFGEEAGNRFLQKMDAEADLAMKGSRWAPNVNSVTGTVMESGATAMGDDLINAGFNLATGNKLGLVRQAINFMRQRGFSQRQIDAIGDLLLSSPEEGLKRLKLMAPDGVPTNALAPAAGLPPPDGSPVPPTMTPAPTGAGPIRAAGFGSNQSGSIRTDVATTLAGGAAGYQAGKDLDLNGDGKVNWEDRAAGVMYGIGGKYIAKAGFKGVANALANPGRRRLGISKGGVLPEGPVYERVPTMEESFDNRFAMAKMTVEQQARKAGETLTPEQLQQRAVQEYRDLYKKDPPGVKSDGTMEAQGWQRALNDAHESLKAERGEGNFTAYDVERAAIDDFVSYYGASRLPKDTLEQADKLVPGTVDPSDLKPQGPIRAGGFAGFGGKKPAQAPDPTPTPSAAERLASGERMEFPPDERAVMQIREASARPEVKNARTLKDAWRAIKAGAPRARSTIDDAIVPDVTTMDIILGAVPPQFREEVARKFLAKYPAQWRVLKEVWPSNPDGTPVAGLRTVEELVEEIAPGYQFQAFNAVGDERAVSQRAIDELGGNPPTRSSGLSGLRTDAGPGAVGGFIGFNQDGEPITADNIGTKARNALIGAGVGVAANRIPVKSGQTATAGIGGGGRGPRKPTVGKPKRDIGTKVADATAIAALGIAPPADGQSGDGVELQAANERVKSATQRVADVDKSIAQLEADKRLLENPASDPRKVQDLLDRRGFDLGPKGLDGRIGPDTRKAIADNIAKIEGEIARKGGEREKAAGEVEKARKGVKDANMRAALRDAEPNAAGDMATKAAQGAAFLAATYAAYRFRKGAVKAYEPVAKAAARRANALVNPGKLTAAKTGPNALNTRAANINEFWKQGGAGERVPFQVDSQGAWSARPGAKEPSKLFKAPRYMPNDVKFMAGAGVEAGGTKYAADKFAEESDKAEADMEKALKTGDDVAFKAALQRKKSADGAEAFLRVLERLGYGAMAGRALSGLVRYPAVRANVNAADSERALLLQAMTKQKPGAKKN